MKDRILTLQRKISSEDLAAFIVTDPINIYYLSGFRGLVPEEREAFLLVDQKTARLFVPLIYQAEARSASGVKIEMVPERHLLFNLLIKELRQYRGKIGFEAENIKFSEFQLLGKKLARLVAKKDFVSVLRQVKDAGELSFIKRAVTIADNAFREILNYIKPGLTEKQIARKLIELMEEGGAEGPSFYPIVAAGASTAIPHYFTGTRKLGKDGPVLLDFGAKVNGYCSDLTRMIHLGRAENKFRRRYQLLRQAQEAALKAAKPNMRAQDLHQIAKNELGSESKYFPHGTGHGIGLAIHEEPILRMGIEDKLVPGMVVTIEPGLYYESEYGIRIEDCGVFTQNGFSVLSKAPKNLIILSSA